MPQCGITNFIYGSECIGDSLVKINDNFSSLESYVCDLSSSTINVTDTSMVSLSYNNISRNLQSYINDRSLTNYKLAFDEGNYGFRNKLINGSFDFWQRGSSFVGITGPALIFTADRWGVLAGGPTGSATVTVKQEPFNAIAPSSQFAGSNPEFYNPKYFLSYSITNPGTSNVWPRLFQRIENVKTLAGRKVTVSFYAYVTSPVQVKTFFKQFITTSPSPTTTTSSSITQTLQPGSWKKYEYVITLPTSPTSNPTASYNYLSNEDYLELCIDIDNNASSTVFFSSIQVEAGTRATAFEIRPYEIELKLCQRFYEKSYEVDVSPGTNSKIGAQILVHGTTTAGVKLISQFQTTKRITPGVGHVKFYHPTTGNFNSSSPNLANTSTDGNIVLDSVYTSSRQLVAQFAGTSTPAVNSMSTWHYAIDVEYI